MKLVFMSDTHTYHRHIPEVPDGDVLIHCGDFTLTGTLRECHDFADWFQKQPHQYKIVIAGNHERVLSDEQTLGFKLFSDCYYLINSSVDIEGYKFYGTPWTPAFKQMRPGLGFYSWDMKGKYGAIPKKVDVLLTHGPPANILDEPYRGDGTHVGDGYLFNQVINRDPLVHAFGHIHESYGIKKGYLDISKTTFINCSLIDHNYNLVNKPIVYNLR